jgi:hypothetical protein
MPGVDRHELSYRLPFHRFGFRHAAARPSASISTEGARYFAPAAAVWICCFIRGLRPARVPASNVLACRYGQQIEKEQAEKPLLFRLSLFSIIAI